MSMKLQGQVDTLEGRLATLQAEMSFLKLQVEAYRASLDASIADALERDFQPVLAKALKRILTK